MVSDTHAGIMSSDRRVRDKTRERDRDRDRDREKEKKSRDSRDKEKLKTSSSEKDKDKDKDKKSSSRSKEHSNRGSKDKEYKEYKERKDKERDREKERHKSVRDDKRKSSSEKSSRKDNSLVKSSSSSRSTSKQKIEKKIESFDNDGSDISEENIKPPTKTIEKVEDDYNYDDDDFEDYDEDFEEDDEEEEEEEGEDEDEHDERKLDSGNYDVHLPQNASIKMQKELAAVKEAMIKENSGQRSHSRNEISDDSGRESPQNANKTHRKDEPRKQSGFINFSAAKERNKVQIAAKAANSRGSELLQMIKLDIVNFDLFDLPPIRFVMDFIFIFCKLIQNHSFRYEAFMKTFGSSNSQQSSTQTGDDNLEVEVQTEEYSSVNKWTQKPPTFGQKTDMEDIDSVRGNLLGVGGDTELATGGDVEYKQNTTSLRLAKFLCGAGQALLAVMEEDLTRREGEMVEGLPQRDIDFADSITVLRIDEVSVSIHCLPLHINKTYFFRHHVCLGNLLHWLSSLQKIL